MVGESPKEKLENYFLKNLRKGYPEETLKWALIKQGHSRIEVQSALEEAKKKMPKPVESEEKPKISYEILDENNKPIVIEKPWWKRIFGN